MCKHKFRVLALLLVFLLTLLSGCGKAENKTGTVEFVKPEQYASVLTVTINPEIKLYLDAKNQILAAEYLNNDAKAAYSELQLDGQSLEDGLSKIVETAIAKDYLKSGNDVTVELIELKDDTIQSATVLTAAESTVQKILTEKAFTANVVTKAAPDITVTTSEPSSDTTTPSSEPKGTESTPPETTQPPTSPPAESTAPPAAKCSACGGSGECKGCHGGRDACPACNGTGYETCPQCNGTGKDHDASCGACGGNGSYLCTHCHGVRTAIDCPKCGGTFKCPACGGTGVQ